MSDRDLHETRLGTTNEDGSRSFIYPDEVSGKWKTRRISFYWFLIIIYLVLPWIYIDGNQSILLNISKREFSFFSYTFYAHNAPLILFILLGFIFTIGFVTSIWGRVWCGWACPQTVFIDTIFRKVEVWVEGNARKRKKLDQSPWNFHKAWKRFLKWFLFLLISLHIAHTFIGYFVGTHYLLSISMKNPSQNMGLFIAVNILTAIFFLDFGWFREQFCIIACPYGRLQSVVMDEHSLAIVYDSARGEPRRAPGDKKGEHADCIDCHACVRACPTGIDIRRGVQLECIACTNCIDACDDIMTRIGCETGLIRYDTQANIDGKKTKVLRPRNIIYLIAIIVIFSGLIYSLNISNNFTATILRGPGAPFKVIKTENLVMNHFKVVLDQSGDVHKRSIQFKILPEDLAKKIDFKIAKNPYPFHKNHMRVNVFIKFNESILNSGTKKFSFQLRDIETDYVIIREASLVGPIK